MKLDDFLTQAPTRQVQFDQPEGWLATAPWLDDPDRNAMALAELIFAAMAELAARRLNPASVEFILILGNGFNDPHRVGFNVPEGVDIDAAHARNAPIVKRDIIERVQHWESDTISLGALRKVARPDDYAHNMVMVVVPATMREAVEGLPGCVPRSEFRSSWALGLADDVFAVCEAWQFRVAK